MWLRKVANFIEARLFPLSRVISGIGAGIFVPVLLLLVADVVMRRLFNSPILGTEEIIEFMMATAIFFTVAYTMVMKGHITIGLVVDRLSPKAQVVIDIFTYLASLVIIFLITWRTALYGITLLDRGLTSKLLGIPVFPFMFVVAFGGALLTLVILAQLLNILAKAVGK